MSDTTPTAPAVTVALSGSMLACGACGIAVSGPHFKRDIDELTISGVDRGRLGTQSLPQPQTVAVTRCTSCRARRDRARQIVETFDSYTRQLGSREVAVERVEAVLTAEAISGRTVRLFSARDLGLALKHLNAAGAAALWSSRLAPVKAADASVKAAQSRPFQHVGEDVKAAARDGFGALLRARLGTFATTPPSVPEDSERSGCLFCGVASSASGWRELAVTPRALGASLRAGWMEAIDGDICGPCNTALASAGSVGQTALREALLQHLGMRRSLGLDAVDMTVIGYGALPEGTPPNAEPWAHIDVEALRRDLADMAERGYVNAGVR